MSDVFDARGLRDCFGKFASGVTVVTCQTPDGTAHGATVSAFTSVSLEPALAQVTLTRGAKIADYVPGVPFAVNILAEDQLDVALHFAGKPLRTEPEWILDSGIPVLCGTVATLECDPWNVYDGGDHLIVVGEVKRLRTNDARPLLFSGGKFHELGPRMGGNPWQGCGDAPELGWFTATTDFGSLAGHRAA